VTFITTAERFLIYNARPSAGNQREREMTATWRIDHQIIAHVWARFVSQFSNNSMVR